MKDWCHKLLKQQLEFGAGTTLLNTIGAKWDYCGREDLVRDLQVPFGVLCEHKGADEDKQNHPLLIAVGCPGQGKSRFLSELPKMIEECRVQLKTEKVQKYQKTLAFLITCENGTSPGDWATVELNAGRFVACRMLWQLRAANQVAFKAAGAPEEFSVRSAPNIWCHTMCCKPCYGAQWTPLSSFWDWTACRASKASTYVLRRQVR